MLIQNVIVAIIIIAAVVFTGRSLMRKRRSFSAKGDCGNDCGCNGVEKKLPS